MLRNAYMTAVLCLTVLSPIMASTNVADGKINRHLPIFPKSSSPSKNMYHANLLGSSVDVQFALTVLQGLVNRDTPMIYITENPGWHGPALIPMWIDQIRGRGYSFEEVQDPLWLFDKFRSFIKGAILYEPDLADHPESLHKLNPITLYCALNDVIPVTPELNDKLKLPVKLDVRGKYNDPEEAYRWAYRELWPKANHELIAHTHPMHMVLRDYLVAHKIMPFWVSQNMSNDAEEICLRFLDETQANSPLLGCWGGYGEQPAGKYSEPVLQRLASLRGKFIVVTDGCFDLTVHSGFEFHKVPRRTSARKLALQNDKVYICFNVTDGDNLQYIQQHFASAQWWADPNRGKVPIGWSMSPNAAELFPDILEYFLNTKTDMDEFVTPTAGIGLVTPALYGKDLYSNYDSVYDMYIHLTAQSMENVGLSSIQLGDTSNVPWTRADFDHWARKIPFLDGIIGDYGGIVGVNRSDAAYMVSNDTPVARAIVGSPDPASRGDNPSGAWVKAIHAATPAERPAFMHVSVINWFDSPTSIMNVVNALGDEYVPVLPSELFDLMRQANGAVRGQAK